MREEARRVDRRERGLAQGRGIEPGEREEPGEPVGIGGQESQDSHRQRVRVGWVNVFHRPSLPFVNFQELL